MRLFLYISDFIVPFMILSILIYGIFAGVNVYDIFIQGAKRGFWTVVRLMPTLIGLMVAVGILRASGFLEFISEIIGNVKMCIRDSPYSTPSSGNMYTYA